MDMLDIYKNKDLQNFSSMLSQFIAGGITDASDIQSAVNDRVNSKLPTSKAVKTVVNSSSATCPECGSTNWHMSKRREGIIYDGCNDCYYSREVK